MPCSSHSTYGKTGGHVQTRNCPRTLLQGNRNCGNINHSKQTDCMPLRVAATVTANPRPLSTLLRTKSTPRRYLLPPSGCAWTYYSKYFAINAIQTRPPHWKQLSQCDDVMVVMATAAYPSCEHALQDIALPLGEQHQSMTEFRSQILKAQSSMSRVARCISTYDKEIQQI